MLLFSVPLQGSHSQKHVVFCAGSFGLTLGTFVRRLWTWLGVWSRQGGVKHKMIQHTSRYWVGASWGTEIDKSGNGDAWKYKGMVVGLKGAILVWGIDPCTNILQFFLNGCPLEALPF